MYTAQETYIRRRAHRLHLVSIIGVYEDHGLSLHRKVSSQYGDRGYGTSVSMV